MAMNDENPSNVCSESVKEVFICYETTTGLDYAKHVKKSLKKINRSAFVASEDVAKGEECRKVVDGTIEACNYFVVIITDSSIRSKEVKRELKLASSFSRLNGNIIPCKEKSVDRSRLSELPIINEFQQIDFETKEELARELINELNTREPAKIASESAPSNKSYVQIYVESIKNNDFFRYVTNLMVSRSILLESSYVKLAISGIVHDPEHRVVMPDWVAGQEYKLFTERRYLEKVKEEMDPEKAVEKWQRIVIIGDPGSGKTTLLKYLTREAACGRLKGELVPFFITLGEYADPRNKATSLIEFACEQYRKRSPLGDEVFEEFVLGVRDMNERRKALFLLDGFDEIPHDRKLGVSGDIERELNRYVLSSRQVGYTGGVLNDKTLEVVELSDPAIQEFIQNWTCSQEMLDHEKRAESRIDHIRIPRLKMLARNPLLLSIQCFVYQSIVESGTGMEIPTRRVDLYKDSITGLLKTLERRGITNQDVDSLDRRISVHSVFADIAFHYFEKVKNAPRHIFGKEELNECLRRISGKLGDHYADLLSDVVFRSEILHPLTMHEYHFLHLTFQEYYTAYHLANQADGIKTIAERKRDRNWREVIPLYAGMKSERFQELMDLIWGKGIDEDLFYNNLFLIGRCLAEVDLKRANIKSHDIEEIKNQLLELSLHGRFGMWRDGANEVLSHISYQSGDIEDKLIESLKDDDSDARGAAANALGEIGSENAIKYLIPLLKDDDSNARGAAANALGRIGAENAIKYLIPLLKDDDSYAREAAANVLGRIGAENAIKYLIPLLKDDDSNVRGAAANALGEIGAENAIKYLIPLLKDDDSYARFAAAYALGRIGAENAIKYLIPLLKDDDSNVRRAAAYALGRIGAENAIKYLIPLLKDDDFYARWTAAEALKRISEKNDLCIPMSSYTDL
ncbi:MAG: HEAT repeat domain-containing protein [Candidatus Methanogasteraceae archaeon]